ncbi:MAG: radical SAM protein [Kiritimatiellia bacterium]
MKGPLICRLCPRQCGVNRTAGELGRCRAGGVLRIFRWGAHHGEEPPISGTKGSGTVFFSHCPLGCIYCQNYPWTAGGAGEDISTERLAAILRSLAEIGCHNWNLVTPEPWLPWIQEAADSVRADGIRLPFVYNTSAYVRPTTAQEYRTLQDIVCADLRYASSACAKEASFAADYPDVARDYIRWCRDQVGPLECDENGIAIRGLIVRLLVLPGHPEEAVQSLRWLARTCGTGLHVSLMSQYTPAHMALRKPGWDREITEEEFAQVTDEADRLGMDTGWTQPYGTATGDDELLGKNMPAGEATVGTPRISEADEPPLT